MLNYNFRITENGKTFFETVSAYTLVLAYEEIKYLYPDAKIILL